ncbi:DNA polymerase IV [Nonomuraea dietziae]|uniref:DNA polymerase IV n=1 Tax=Nonomuraea dietziae TaxID=65515 RepID=UPI0031DE60F9
MRDWVLHLDLDAFMAAVEILRNPELRGRPVVVGGNGDPTTPRTVVATASYEAREYGVHSGLPMRTALRRCPDAVYLPIDLPAYEAASAAVMTLLHTSPSPSRCGGLDEALPRRPHRRPRGSRPRHPARRHPQDRLTCSIGIGDNKHQAKLAAQFEKPSGVSRLTTDTWPHVMGERPTTALWGIGAKTGKKLADLGLHTVAQLAAADPAELAARFGPTNGPWLRYLALGKGESTVTTTPWVPRGHSHETTFTQDLTDPAAMRAHVAAMAVRLAAETEGRPVVRVTVKVRSAPFTTHTRQAKLPEPTHDATTIEQAALAVFDRFDHGRPVRLLGVSVEYG